MKKRSGLLRKKNVKKEALKKRWKVLFKLLFILALAGGLVWGGRYGLSRFRFFSIAKIDVLGDPKTLSTQEIVERSGVQLGTNLFQVDIQGIQAKLKTHPFFKSVTVQRSYPKTLVIEVKEYFPELVLNTNRLYYVDQNGEIFKDITDTKDTRDFPVLSGITDDMILTDPTKAKAAIKSAVELKKTYQQSPLDASLGLSEIHYEKNIGYTLYPEKKKYSIKVGLKDFSEKIQKMTDHLKQIEESKAEISSVDLSYPGKILMTL